MAVKSEKPKKTYALNIFSLLARLERGDLHVYETLSEDERKSLSPYTVIQWMFGTTNKVQVGLLNELVNPFIFSFAKHQELLVKLLAVSGMNTTKKFTWMPLPKSKGKEPKLRLKVLMDTHDWSEREAKGNLHLLDATDYLEMAEDLGWEKTDITKLKAELK